MIWQFSQNKDDAQQFLVDYASESSRAFQASEFYNLPCFPGTVPDLASQLAHDSHASPSDKYKVLAASQDCVTNIGYPGYATPVADEVFRTYVIPSMFAKVAADILSPQEAVSQAEKEISRILKSRN